MNGYLLDTNVALFAVAHSARLSPAVRSIVASGLNRISASSYWEVFVKSMRGNLEVGDPRVWWVQALSQLAAVPIAIRPEHIERLHGLPPIHRDPFDRILIATAIAENLTLVTTGRDIPRYASEHLRVLA